eukprot:SM000100S09430  [mRNA]  locus=s100:354034:354551:- [translate_table: standard]
MRAARSPATWSRLTSLPRAEGEKPAPNPEADPEPAGFDPAAAEGKTYGDAAEKPGQAAERAAGAAQGHEADGETLESTGFDMSKMSRPAGDE